MYSNKENRKEQEIDQRSLKNRLAIEQLLEEKAELIYKYLDRVDLLDQRIEEFCRIVPTYRQDVATQFLRMLMYDNDATVSVLARYELTQHSLEIGNTVYERLLWNYEPQSLIDALKNGTELPKQGAEPIQMILSSISQVA